MAAAGNPVGDSPDRFLGSNTDLVEMRKGRSVEDLDRQRMAELETAFEQSAEEEPEQGMEV